MHWIYENGIGEERAALIGGGSIIQARIERESTGIRPGAVVMARLARKIGSGKRAIAKLETGEDAIISALPKALTEGQDVRVSIVRSAISEEGSELGRYKYPLGKAVGDDVPLAPSPGLKEQIAEGDIEIRTCAPHGPDLLAEAGWDDVMHEALSGHVAFPGGSLVMAATPAMTVIDVDGESAPRPLALDAAKAAAEAIYRLDIGGSSGIDFPALPGKADRGDVAIAFDEAMQGPFERTAVNGFGFMQVVRKYMRPSLLQTLQADTDLTALLSLLRRAERAPGSGDIVLQLTPAMAALLESRPDWQERLRKNTGRTISVSADAGCTEAASYLSRQP